MRVDPSDRFVRFACRIAAAMTRYHRAELEGDLPGGPALLVGNHGLFGLESPVFFWLLHQRTGRFPLGLADRHVFGGTLRRLVGKVGGVPGTRDDAVRLLGEGNLVVCYPGGAREVFKRPDERYQLRWERSNGFAHVAIAAQANVVPFAGIGVDHSFLNFGHFTRAFGRYSPPLAVGPLPARLRFRLGAPMAPPSTHALAGQFKAQVQAAVERLLEIDGVPAQLAAAVVR